MTLNANAEIKKIRQLLKNNLLYQKFDNSLVLLEKKNQEREEKYYIYKRFSEILRIDNEMGLNSSFSELIFLELFSQNQLSSNFNFLLQQTMELLIGYLPLFCINDMIKKFFNVTSWNLVNPTILLRFTSIYNQLIEAKGLKLKKDSHGKKQDENSFNSELFVLKIEKIRSLIDKKDFSISGILINGLFRSYSWDLLGNLEKKIFSEQILRIILKSQNLPLISKFYFIQYEYYYSKEKNCEFSKICLFLSSIYYRLANELGLNLRLEKLLKMKVKLLFDYNILDNFEVKNSSIIKLSNIKKNLLETDLSFISLLKSKYLSRIRKSFKAKLILEKIEKIPYAYKSLTIKTLKNWTNLDTRDLEYFLLNCYQKNKNLLTFDHYRGILYFNLI